MKVEYINPFVASTVSAFGTMLECQLKRGQLSLKEDFRARYDISGIIGLSGRVSGTVVLSLHKDVALNATETLLGSAPDSINEDVVDAVGELANVIAGQAKASLEQYQMSLSLPAVIVGAGHIIAFETKVKPICVPFDSPWGPLTVEVGLVGDF